MANGLFKNTTKGGVYYGAYTTKDGKRKQFSTGTKNERSAQKKFVERLQQIFEEEDRPKLRTVTLSEFRKTYIAFRIGERVSHSQIKELQASLTFLERLLGDVCLHYISVQDCERFIANGWRPEGWSSLWTARKHFQNLHAAFDAAVRWKHIRENPFRELKKPKPDERMPEIFTRRELGTLFDALPDQTEPEQRLRNIIVLAVNTGLRLGEILNLEKRDVDFTRNEIIVRAKKDWTPKSRKPRVVPLPEDAVRALRSQQALNSKTDNDRVLSSSYFFPNLSGCALTPPVVERPLKKVCTELFPNRKLHFHSLRHTYGSFLCEAGVPLQEIQRIMGHSSVKVTEIYARLRNNNFSNALNVLNAVPSLVRREYTSPEAFEETEVLECSRIH